MTALDALSNTSATFEPQFMKKLSNTEVELKKALLFLKKSVLHDISQIIAINKKIFIEMI